MTAQVKMIILLALIFVADFEQLYNLEFGGFVLSIGDLLLLLTATYSIFLKEIKHVLPLVIALFISSIISTLYNGSYGAYSSSITIPLRFMVAAYVINLLSSNAKKKLPVGIIAIAALLQLGIAIIFSGVVMPGDDFDLFNRNSAGGYLVLFVLIYSVATKMTIIRQHVIYISLGLILYIIDSRQLMLGTILSYFIFNLIGLRKIYGSKLIKKGILLIVSTGVIVSFISLIVINSQDKDYASARLSTITSFEPQTRADRIRYHNVIQGIDGFYKSPILGYGPKSFRINNEFDRTAHSTPISVIYEFGLVGFCILLFVLITLLKPLIRIMIRGTSSNQLLYSACLLIIPFVQSFFIEMYSKLILPIAFGIALHVYAQLRLVAKSSSRSSLLPVAVHD